MVTKKHPLAKKSASQRGRLTVRFYDTPVVPGFIPVDQMLVELVVAKRSGATGNKVVHSAIKLLHRETFPELYESPEDSAAERLAQRERDRQVIAGGHDVATRSAATEAALHGLREKGGEGQETLANMLSAAGWKQGPAGEWIEPTSRKEDFSKKGGRQ